MVFFFFLLLVVVAAAVDDSPGIIKDLSIYDRFPLVPFILYAGPTPVSKAMCNYDLVEVRRDDDDYFPRLLVYKKKQKNMETQLVFRFHLIFDEVKMWL